MKPDHIEVLPNGQWVIAGDTHISKWAKEWGTIKCDPHLFKLMEPWLEGVTTVWDIGACIGDHTRFYLDMDKQVVAVEPNPRAFACLAHNCPEATLLNLAASNKAGTLNFDTLANEGASRIAHGGGDIVVAAALDSLNLPPPQFVKLDVEGWEPHALEGMAKTLRTHRPKCFVEINQGALAANGFDFRDITHFFRDLGYQQRIAVPEDAKFGDPQFDVLFLP